MAQLVRTYGFDIVSEHIPEDDARLMTHIRKLSERQQRKRAENAEDGDGGNGNNDNNNDNFDDMLDSDEEDSDGGRTLATGVTGFTRMTAKSGKSLRSEAMEKSERSKSVKSTKVVESKTAEGEILVTKGGGLDLLDAAAMSKSVRYVGGAKKGYDEESDDDDDDEMMEFDDGGKLMIDDPVMSMKNGLRVNDKGKGVGNDGGKVVDADSEDDEEGNGKGGLMKYEIEKKKNDERQRKRQKTAAKNVPGVEFKSKKSGGDVKKKGAKFEPYAFVPLDGKAYTKKNRRGAVEQMDHVVNSKSKKSQKRKRGRD